MFQPRLYSNCITDGNTYLLTLLGLIKKMPDHHYYLEEQDQFNWEDVANQLTRKCNFADSFEGTLVLNFMINRIYDLPLKWISSLMPLVFVLEVLDWTSIINSIVNMAYSFNVQMTTFDAFNGAKIWGKIVKILFQLYMKGYLSKRKLVKGVETEELLEL